MTKIITRPSKVDGLVVSGWPGHYRIHATRADGMVLVETGPANQFTRIRDANTAALRLDGLLPWGTDELDDAVKAGNYQELRGKIVEGLAGRPLAEIIAEDERRRDEERQHYDGTAARDWFDIRLRALGHTVTWKRKGQRTFWGRCATCGAEYRSSYQSMSDSYARSGPQWKCEQPAGGDVT